MGLKTKKSLSRVELDLVADLHQMQSGLAQVISNAQTKLADAEIVYSKALDAFNAANMPALQAARTAYSVVENKARYEAQTVEEQIRAIRTIELE